MQRTGQLHRSKRLGQVAPVIAGIVLLILVIGLWVLLWVPLWSTR